VCALPAALHVSDWALLSVDQRLELFNGEKAFALDKLKDARRLLCLGVAFYLKSPSHDRAEMASFSTLGKQRCGFVRFRA
jgi:hypothetical protein